LIVASCSPTEPLVVAAGGKFLDQKIRMWDLTTFAEKGTLKTEQFRAMCGVLVLLTGRKGGSGLGLV
jgi:hypothetical protein